MSGVMSALYVFIGLTTVLDLFLISGAIKRAAQDQTVGRLGSTACVLVGILLASYGRVLSHDWAILSGLTLVAVGLFGYAVYLPDEGLRSRWRSRRPK